MSAKNPSFEYQSFVAPDISYAPMYGWLWNAPLSKEVSEERLQEMQRLGVRAFYIIPQPHDFRPASQPTFLDPDYLTSAYMEQYRYVMDRAHQMGMACWIYDEGGWPSGGASGRVMLEHPEYARRSLACRQVEYRAGQAYAPSDKDTAAAFISGTKMIEDGYVFTADTVVDEYYSRRIAFLSAGSADYPDLTRKEATQAFIEKTHERYKEFLGDRLGNFIGAIFTDEPCAPGIPFRKELCEIYEEKYGESILPHLPALLKTEYVTDDNVAVRRRWFDMCSRLFCENFMLECKKWTNENGMKFTGHMDNEDTLNGSMTGRSYHIMRALRCMDIPGVDAIWRQVYPGKEHMCDGVECASNRFFPRCAISAAAQNGSELAMSEMFGIYSDGATFDQLRFVAGFHTVRGVTIINPMYLSYGRKGFQMTGGEPAFAEYKACHADLPTFNRYLERLSYVCSCGDRVCDTALYYPINNVWDGREIQKITKEYEGLGFAMETRGIDFDIIDDDIFAGATGIENGVIKHGIAAYKQIAIPAGAYINDKTAEVLKVFAANGGKICYCAEDVIGAVELSSNCTKIRAMKRNADGTEMVVLFNEDDAKRNVTLSVNCENCSLINITDGEISALKAVDGKVTVSLESGETCAVYMEMLPAQREAEREYANTLVLDKPYQFRRTKGYVIGDMHPETHTFDEAPAPMELGDWSCFTGCDFSGSGIYTTTFENVEGDAILDLGEVKYTCEVTVNGHNLGVKVMKPYRYRIPAAIMKEVNQLEIRVTNTAANQCYYTKSFDKWQRWQMTPYYEKQKAFYADTLDSGLYGPVKLHY